MEMPRLLSRASLWEVVVISDMFLWANSWAAKKKQRIEKKISDGGFLEVSSNILMKIQDLGILLHI